MTTAPGIPGAVGFSGPPLARRRGRARYALSLRFDRRARKGKSA